LVASSSATRWRLACDACGAGAWLGSGAGGFDAWCEACQTPQRLDAAPTPGARCVRCGAPLAVLPRFVELWGELQHLDAVLGAWAGDGTPLATLLPERPRFVTDLTPPAPAPGDPPARLALLAAVARGDWRAVLAAPPDACARAHAARAIAHERLGEVAGALAAWDAVLAAGEDARARLARGSLLARAGRHAAAAADLAVAGVGFEARWDRAALLVHEVVAAGAGPPDAARLARARAEVGAASDYWSDPTVGRLLWTLQVERELARPGAGAGELPDEARAALRAAESELEHDTFWDRALLLVGWVRLGALDEAARIAAPLARRQSAALLDEPALAGRALGDVARALAAARSAMDAGDPVGALREIAAAFARDDLRRFRIPCAACGRGTVGIEETAEAGV
jgi:hypothetical protein